MILVSFLTFLRSENSIKIKLFTSMSVQNIPCTEMCAYQSDEDNCDNVFSNYGNSSNTDSSDNGQ